MGSARLSASKYVLLGCACGVVASSVVVYFASALKRPLRSQLVQSEKTVGLEAISYDGKSYLVVVPLPRPGMGQLTAIDIQIAQDTEDIIIRDIDQLVCSSSKSDIRSRWITMYPIDGVKYARVYQETASGRIVLGEIVDGSLNRGSE